MNKILTVSIAAYNVENYLRETLESCIIPDFMNELEILIEDDGSKDNTSEIAKEFTLRYPDTFRLISKKNGGYGSTVNRSMKEAVGKYFKLMDGDDWFDKNGLYNLIKHLKNSQSDIIITNTRRVTPDGILSIKDRVWWKYYNKTMRIEEVGDSLLVGMWEITYRTDILKEHPFELPEHTLYTDQLFVYYPSAYIQTVDFLPDEVYCYRLGRDGQSVSKESRIKHYKETLSVCELICEYYENISKDNVNKKYMLKRACCYYSKAIRTLLLMPCKNGNKNLIKQYENEIQKISNEVYYGAAGESRLIKILRATNYHAYWIIKLRGIKNWG